MPDNSEKQGDASTENLLPLWQQLHNRGVAFIVDGQAVVPAEAVSRAVREDGVYMTDYVLGEEGKLEQVRFDRLNLG